MVTVPSTAKSAVLPWEWGQISRYYCSQEWG